MSDVGSIGNWSFVPAWTSRRPDARHRRMAGSTCGTCVPAIPATAPSSGAVPVALSVSVISMRWRPAEQQGTRERVGVLIERALFRLAFGPVDLFRILK